MLGAPPHKLTISCTVFGEGLGFGFLRGWRLVLLWWGVETKNVCVSCFYGGRFTLVECSLWPFVKITAENKTHLQEGKLNDSTGKKNETSTGSGTVADIEKKAV